MNSVIKLNLIYMLGGIIDVGLFYYISVYSEKNILYYFATCIYLIIIGLLIYLILYLMLDCLNMSIILLEDKIIYIDYIGRKQSFNIDEISVLKMKVRNEKQIQIIFPTKKKVCLNCNEIINGERFVHEIMHHIEASSNHYELIKKTDTKEATELLIIFILLSIGLILPGILT